MDEFVHCPETPSVAFQDVLRGKRGVSRYICVSRHTGALKRDNPAPWGLFRRELARMSHRCRSIWLAP